MLARSFVVAAVAVTLGGCQTDTAVPPGDSNRGEAPAYAGALACINGELTGRLSRSAPLDCVYIDKLGASRRYYGRVQLSLTAALGAGSAALPGNMTLRVLANEPKRGSDSIAGDYGSGSARSFAADVTWQNRGNSIALVYSGADGGVLAGSSIALALTPTASTQIDTEEAPAEAAFVGTLTCKVREGSTWVAILFSTELRSQPPRDCLLVDREGRLQYFDGKLGDPPGTLRTKIIGAIIIPANTLWRVYAEGQPSNAAALAGTFGKRNARLSGSMWRDPASSFVLQYIEWQRNADDFSIFSLAPSQKQ